MTIGIVGRKSGMTRVFSDEGVSIPVSVIEVSPNRITQVKNVETDGYSAVQVTVGSRRPSRVVKAAAGHFSKASSEAGSSIVELRCDVVDEFTVGGELTVSSFESGQIVDVIGSSKGKGFAGVIKRWNFSMQDATHGNSLSHRAPGSIGQCQTPGRVFKGKKMAGHMGSERVTVQNLEVVKVDAERNLLLVKGAIPGAPGGEVIIRPAVKMINRKASAKA
ncbi:MAG: 50S ribosomal protein L3 [Cellvibrionaceae bacterium]